MRQCPDCEEKDRVVIAGKVFCANCGTPWQPVDPSEEATYKQKIGMDAAAPAPASAPPAANPPAPTPASAPVAAPTPAPSAPVASPNPSTPPTPATAQVSVEPPPTPVSVVPTPTPIPATPPPTPAPSPESKPLAELQSRVGSEIPSLDSKDEFVLSDSQIREMGSVKSQVTVLQTDPVPVSAPVPTAAQSAPSQPSVAPQPAPTPTPTPPSPPQPAPTAPQANRVLNDVVAPQSAPAPSQSNVASPAPVAASDTNTTVAGVTMSREDALKLALGEDAVPEAATKTGPARPTAVVMTVIGLALLGVFLWQVNASDIQVKLASLRAGLTASVPGFVPGGWSGAQSLKASEGGVSYELVKDGKTLKIEQQKSDWDSQAVLEQYVLRRSTDYLALQSQGLTIYMFGDNQAAWVNQGTFYTLSGDHGIEQDDIIRMATSL